MAAEHVFELAHLAHGLHYLALGGAHHGALRHHVLVARGGEGVVILVDIDHLVAMKVDGVGVERPGAAEEIGVVDLERQRFPSAGGPAGQHARPGFRDHAKVLFEVGDELFQQGIAVGAVVGRVDGVGIVEIGRGMLPGDGDHAGEVVGHPGFGKLRSPAPAGFAEAVRSVQAEVALDVDYRVAFFGMLVVPLGEQDRGSDVDGVAPELGKHGALDPDVLDPCGVGRQLDGRNDVRELEFHIVSRGRVEVHLVYLAVKVPGRARELLAFPLIHVGPDGVAVGAREAGVDVH